MYIVLSQTLVMSIPIITDVGGLVGGIIAGIFFLIILVVCLLLCTCRMGICSSFRRPQRRGYSQLTQPYSGQQGYPTTPCSTQPQQPPPSDHAPGGSEYPPPYSYQDISNIRQQSPPPYPCTH